MTVSKQISCQNNLFWQCLVPENTRNYAMEGY